MPLAAILNGLCDDRDSARDGHFIGHLPEIPEAECGWIETGLPIGSPVPHSVNSVSRFWEKPSGSVASSLMERTERSPSSLVFTDARGWSTA
jgi:mannose-1-phosphate guanylyltransferase